MTQTETRSQAPTNAQPEIYRLRTPLMKQGRSDITLSKTENMTVRIKCYAAGGENEFHAHAAEDHTFVVLAGQARFSNPEGEIATLGRNEGIMLPRGAFYKFESCADEPLVLMRVGAKVGTAEVPRVTTDGRPIPGDSLENKTVPPIVMEGAFYE
ncbi:MAG TPA: cupin domain-containing protein [Chloroflexota bacterium]|nr:cupin domain-containing protein [Chloroflexota bacterium]